jgi:heterodisulfide reductase subunit C
MAVTPRERSLADLGAVFLEHVYRIPGGEKIKTCIQCGTCSGSCPTSAAMDYTPREIIAAFRAGLLDKVLRSNTVWMCASCYSCSVRCPSGIKLTDIMYELKRLGIEYGLYAKGAKSPTLSKDFLTLVNRYGRNSETEMLARFFMKTNPLGLVGMAPMGIKMILRGRLPLLPDQISPKGREEMRKILEYCGDKDRGEA